MTDTYETEALLIKTDSAGNMLWYNVYGSDGYEQVNKVVQTTDGGYMLGGRTVNSYSSSYDWYLVKTDSAGNEEWHDTFGGSYEELAMFGLIRLSDGNILASGQRKAGEIGDFSKYKARLLKVNNAGSTIWVKEYDLYADLTEPLDSMYGVFFSITEKEDGILFAVLTKGLFQQGFYYTQLRSAIMKLNSNGDSLYTRTFYLPEYDESEYSNNLYDIEQTSDGGFVMAGYCHFSEEDITQVPWLVKVDSLGYDGTFIREFESENINVFVYPNPSNGIYNLDIEQRSVHKTYTCCIFDLVGRQLYKKRFTAEKSLKIDITGQPVGIYFLSLELDGQVVYGTKVIKK